MENKKYDFLPKYKIWLETTDGKGILGDGKWLLLKTIEETGSLKDAIEKLGLSYRKTWNNLQQIEKRFGCALLETTRGGVDGGGNTYLTPEGKKIVKAFDKFHSSFDKQINEAFKTFIQDLK